VRGDATLFVDERLDRLFLYWCSLRRGRPAPGRPDLDPADIPDLLPIINLIDVRPEPPRFRHRLIGTEIVDRLGRDLTGAAITEATYGSIAPAMCTAFAAVADQVRPHRQMGWMDDRRRWFSVETVQLPLIDGTGRTNMLLVGTSIMSRHGARPVGCSDFHPLVTPAIE
jgi:hypothetical protein